MSSKDLIDETIETLKELESEINTPKNIKTKLQNIIKMLEEGTEVSIKINKALNELEEVSGDPNLEPFIRTQIWNIVSVLEKINR